MVTNNNALIPRFVKNRAVVLIGINLRVARTNIKHVSLDILKGSVISQPRKLANDLTATKTHRISSGSIVSTTFDFLESERLPLTDICFLWT